MIGIAEIDEEHKNLFETLHDTMDYLDCGGSAIQACKHLTDKLNEYACTHFVHEEAYMEQIGDLQLPRQKQEHAQFKEIIESYQLTGLDEERSQQVIIELLTFISQWLYHHIRNSDTMIGKNTTGL